MSTYFYKAKKNTAETVNGTINARTQEEAVELISDLGLIPVHVEEKRVETKLNNLRKPKKVRPKEVFVFSRQLSNLLRTGVPVLRALSILEGQTQNDYFQSVIAYIANDIKNGETMSDSLSNFSDIFSSLYITMVHAGEESGNLQDILMSLADYQQQQEELSSKVRMALAYPCLMGIVGFLTVYFVMTFVFPKMANLFDTMGDNLPLPTKILMHVSDALSIGWVWILICLLTVTFAMLRWVKSAKGRASISRFILGLPIFGSIILKTELTRFCRTVVLLLKSGVSVIMSLQIATPILSNDILKAKLLMCIDNLVAGGSLGASLQNVKEIPAMMGHLICVGEETGNLTDVLNEVAHIYEQETAEQIKIMTTLLEPLMILSIGLVIAFIVFAMLLPIFQINTLL